MTRKVNGFVGAASTIEELISKFPPINYVGCFANVGNNPTNKAVCNGEVWSEIQTSVTGDRNARGFARMGDSRPGIQWLDSSTRRNVSNADPYNWANAILGRRLVTLANTAIAGQRIDQQLPYLPVALASGARYLMLHCGVNDISQGRTALQVYTDIATICDAAQAVGMVPIIFLEPGASNYTAADIQQRNELNQRLLEYAETSRREVVLFDLPGVVLNPTNASTIAFKAGYSQDGVHLSALGARKAGEALATLLATRVAPLPCQPVDILQARPGGRQLLSNGLFATGTGGTPGSGNTGTLPANWSGLRTGTSSAVYSVAADANGWGNEVSIAATFAAANETVRLVQALTIADFTNGSILQGGFEIDVSAGATGLLCVAAQLDVTVDGSQTIQYDLLGSSTYGSDPGGYTGIQLRTQPLVVPAGALTAANLVMRCVASGAGSATVKVRRPWAVLRSA